MIQSHLLLRLYHQVSKSKNFSCIEPLLLLAIYNESVYHKIWWLLLSKVLVTMPVLTMPSLKEISNYLLVSLSSLHLPTSAVQYNVVRFEVDQVGVGHCETQGGSGLPGVFIGRSVSGKLSIWKLSPLKLFRPHLYIFSGIPAWNNLRTIGGESKWGKGRRQSWYGLGQEGKGQEEPHDMTVGLMRHVKDFRPYPKGSGKLLKGLKEGLKKKVVLGSVASRSAAGWRCC